MLSQVGCQFPELIHSEEAREMLSHDSWWCLLIQQVVDSEEAREMFQQVGLSWAVAARLGLTKARNMFLLHESFSCANPVAGVSAAAGCTSVTDYFPVVLDCYWSLVQKLRMLEGQMERLYLQHWVFFFQKQNQLIYVQLQILF